MRVAVIINPISGTAGRGAVVARRIADARAWIEARGAEADVRVSERPGHARELAEQAVAREVPLVLAWGGDGTVNEVGSVLAYRRAALGIVPAGSGNGLARELGVPLDPAAAVAAALDGRERVMDAGELDGRLFFNVAGIGLDARVAHAFAAGGALRRGLRRYLALTVREWFAARADHVTLVMDGVTLEARTLIVAFANARQYGNGLRIAPEARLDDGQLDVVVIGFRGPLAGVVHIPRMLAGRIGDVPGVTLRRARHIEISAAAPIAYHVDGEPFRGGPTLTARARAAALRVRVPRSAG